MTIFNMLRSELMPWKNLFKYYSLYSKRKINYYKDIHKKSTIVCVGCGPSLNSINQDIFRSHPCIYLNSSFQLNSQIKSCIAYSLIQDHNRLRELSSVDRSCFNASFRCAYNFSEFDIRYFNKAVDVVLMPKLRLARSSLFLKPEGAIDEVTVSKNFSSEVNLIGYSVMFTAIQLAIWMGATNVLLAGYDLDYSNANNIYFNQKTLDRAIWIPDYRTHIMPAARSIKIYAQSLGVRIVNINVNSKDLVFEKLDYFTFLSRNSSR